MEEEFEAQDTDDLWNSYSRNIGVERDQLDEALQDIIDRQTSDDGMQYANIDTLQVISQAFAVDSDILEKCGVRAAAILYLVVKKQLQVDTLRKECTDCSPKLP